MAKTTKHKLSNIDIEKRIADCANCGPVKVYPNSIRWWICSRASNEAVYKYRRKYRFSIDRSKCSRCSFQPEDDCQIDVDHIDGDHNNHDIQNLQALCSNCHRLKTYGRSEYSKILTVVL